MMSKVIKPDNTEVTFKYDSLGRRIEKSSDEKIMRFVWDGNTVLHEYFSEIDSAELENQVESQNKSEIPDNLVTWVFNDGLIPSAKITSEGNYSIISDYLGTPVETYDEEGNLVWSAELDIYGRVRNYTGEGDFIPYLFAGQYEDDETGLYYNRWRYYDPSMGTYTQIDPIGLVGGNPTLYGYVKDTNKFIDPFGLEIDDPFKIFFSQEERLFATLYGGIIGDLMGVPVEFKKRGTFHVEDVIGYGTYNQPPGTWSDDTSLTLCLVENMIEKGDTRSLMDKFVRYMEQGYLTPFGEMFDIGITTADAVSSYKKGVLPEHCGKTGEFDNGNGTLMRIAPLVFVLINEGDFKKRKALVQQYTMITHGHPRSIVGSIIYIELLLSLYRNNSLEFALNEVFNLLQNNLQHELYTELNAYSRIFDENFLSISEDEIKSSGYIVHSLEAAIWSVGHASTFKEAILKAVNLGEDTDTIAAITGALAGMCHQMNGIPEDWLNAIVKKQEIDDVIEAFYEFCFAKI